MTSRVVGGGGGGGGAEFCGLPCACGIGLGD